MLIKRYPLENIEFFYISMRSMGAIMDSFAKADNPLISKKNRSPSRPPFPAFPAWQAQSSPAESADTASSETQNADGTTVVPLVHSLCRLRFYKENHHD